MTPEFAVVGTVIGTLCAFVIIVLCVALTFEFLIWLFDVISRSPSSPIYQSMPYDYDSPNFVTTT